jgi:hypothetical protein
MLLIPGKMIHTSQIHILYFLSVLTLFTQVLALDDQIGDASPDMEIGNARRPRRERDCFERLHSIALQGFHV